MYQRGSGDENFSASSANDQSKQMPHHTPIIEELKSLQNNKHGSFVFDDLNKDKPLLVRHSGRFNEDKRSVTQIETVTIFDDEYTPDY